MARTLRYNFEKLPRDYRKPLFTLSEDEDAEVKTAVALAVGQNFEDLPPEYRGF